MPDEDREIIAMSAQLLDDCMRTVGVFDALVRPQMHAEMPEETLRRTGITYSMVSEASCFSEVFSSFLSFCSDADVVYTFGRDALVLQENMRWYDSCSDYGFLLKCKDCRPLFSEFGIGVGRFTSGTLYLAFEDECEDADFRSPAWDVESVSRSLRHIADCI